MSAEQDRARLIAERIARRMSESREPNASSSSEAKSSAPAGDDIGNVRATLDELKRKILSLEDRLGQEKEDSQRAAGKPGQERVGTQAESNQERRSSSSGVGPSAAHSPWLSGMYVPATHPSEEKFGVEEAAVSELVDFFEREKICELEPGGKPCNHCAMCNTRGF